MAEYRDIAESSCNARLRNTALGQVLILDSPVIPFTSIGIGLGPKSIADYRTVSIEFKGR